MAVLAAAWAIPYTAQAETTLTLSSWLPATHPVVVDIISPWAERVEAATNGEVRIQILPTALGKPQTHFDLAKDGIADVTYGAQGYSPGRFVTTDVSTLPFLGDYAEATSAALWRTHAEYFAKANEYQDVKLIGLFMHGPGQIHTSRKTVTDIADMQGLKIRTTGGYVKDIAERLGMVAILKPVTEAYTLLSQGVADGILLPTESMVALDLAELVPHTTQIAGGLYSAPFFLVMNQAKFDALSPEAQKAIDEVSGETLARVAGNAFDKRDAQAVADITAAGNEVIAASPELVEQIRAAVGPIEQEWVAAVEAKGISGDEALAYFREQIALIEAEIAKK